MSKLSESQKKVLTFLSNGYEFRINPVTTSYNPTLIKEGSGPESISMKTVTCLLNKKLIKHSEKFDPPYHYYVLTDKAIMVLEKLKS